MQFCALFQLTSSFIDVTEVKPISAQINSNFKLVKFLELVTLHNKNSYVCLFSQAEVQKIIAVAWNIFQPLLFGLIGAEVSVASLRPETVGKNFKGVLWLKSTFYIKLKYLQQVYMFSSYIVTLLLLKHYYYT